MRHAIAFHQDAGRRQRLRRHRCHRAARSTLTPPQWRWLARPPASASAPTRSWSSSAGAGIPTVDFVYRIFNADGGEVEQCGNGARCFVKFVRDRGLTDKPAIRVRDARRRHRAAARRRRPHRGRHGRAASSTPRRVPFDTRGLASRPSGRAQLWPLAVAVLAAVRCAGSRRSRWAIRMRCRSSTSRHRAGDHEGPASNGTRVSRSGQRRLHGGRSTGTRGVAGLRTGRRRDARLRHRRLRGHVSGVRRGRLDAPVDVQTRGGRLPHCLGRPERRRAAPRLDDGRRRKSSRGSWTSDAACR